jgi:small subunit ribosomal protein S8e
MGISRDSRHKRSATGAKRATYRKKRYGTESSFI